MPSLPSPRQLLTDLLSSLTPHAPPGSAGRSPIAPGNALQNVTSADRHLLSTLHVLFPSLLLPSLDLLDRGLVARITQQAREGSVGTDGPLPADPAEMHNAPLLNHFHLVQSAQESRGKRFGQSAAGTSYIVRLQAWNCTCAAFTFSAFPASGSHHFEETREHSQWGMPSTAEGVKNAGEFGGLSLDGANGEAVPCCKHLLACLLAERWESVLGDYVTKRNADREEMAGIGGAT